MCSELPAKTFISVVLAGGKAALCTSHSCAGAATSWGSLCSWSHTPMRRALTHLGDQGARICVEAPPRQDTRTHTSHSKQKVALKNCPVLRRAVNPPSYTVILGRMTPSICFTSRPIVPWNPPTMLLLSRWYPLAFPKSGTFYRVSWYTARNTFLWCWKPPHARCHHFFHMCGSPYGRTQAHLTPVMMIQVLPKACEQVLAAAAAPGSTYCSLGIRASPCPMPWFVLPPAVHTRCPRRHGMLGSLKPEHTIFSLLGITLPFLGSFLHCVTEPHTAAERKRDKQDAQF